MESQPYSGRVMGMACTNIDMHMLSSYIFISNIWDKKISITKNVHKSEIDRREKITNKDMWGSLMRIEPLTSLVYSDRREYRYCIESLCSERAI